MLTEQRHEIILKLLKEKGSITLTEIRETLNVSESTARRDLTELDKEKKLTKVFGGAILTSSTLTTSELSVSQKETVCISEKHQIGKYAASLVEKGDFIYLDAGTTTGCMIDYLDAPDITVVTNAVDHARKLSLKNIKVIILGGELKGITEAVVGSEALLSLSRFHFTKGFVGANGVHPLQGFTTPDNSEAVIKSLAIENSRERFVLADHEKFGNVTSIAFADFDDAKVITDSGIDDSYRKMANVIVSK